MAPSRALRATVVQTLSGEVSLREGEEVAVLDLYRGPTSRWLVRVGRREGGEATIRPSLLGQARSSKMPRLPKLRDAELMVQELNFWQRLWEPVSPRKAEAMGRMARWVSSSAREQRGALPPAVLRKAWSHYWTERRAP